MNLLWVIVNIFFNPSQFSTLFPLQTHKLGGGYGGGLNFEEIKKAPTISCKCLFLLYGDPTGNRTRVSGVRGQRPDR